MTPGKQPSHETARKPSAAQAEACAAFLADFGRSVKVISLYQATHPIAVETVREAHAALERVIGLFGTDRVTLTLAEDRWLCNDLPVSAGGQAHDVLKALFAGHDIRSMTFLSGVRPFELASICELEKGASAHAGRDELEEFLVKRGVKHVLPDDVRYAKEAPAAPDAGAAPPEPAQEKGPPEPAAEPPAGPPAEPPGDEQHPGARFKNLLRELVESAVGDPTERGHIYEDVVHLVQDALDRHVSHATKALAEEKAKLLDQQARTQRVLTTVAEGKVIVDQQGKVLMMNPTAETLTGKRLADMVGRHITEGVRAGEQMVTISQDLSEPVQVVADDEVSRTMRQSLAVVQDDTGRVVGTYASLPEVTKYKEALRLREEFLSRVTHDLQSPLASICCALELLSAQATPNPRPGEVDYLGICMRNSEQLKTMIRGILDFSKLEAGQMPVHPAPAPAAALLKEAVESLQPWAAARGLSLSARPVPAGLTVLADHQRIVQVLTNLVSNAIKNTPKGGSVVVAATAGSDGLHAVFAVRDTGCGIPKESLTRIFEKFVQVERDGGAREGVGLGLPIVSEFVKLHGGRVWADSVLGKGSIFYFTLPLADAPPRPKEDPAAAPHRQSPLESR